MDMSSDFDTTNLYRPNQVEETRAELKSIEDTLAAPPHVRGKISDVRAMRQRGQRLKADLDKYEPKPYRAEERDAAVAEFDRLNAEIKQGMPSSEEMRRNPPGAVDKHLAWERRNKRNIARMKHVGLRLAAGGDVRDDLGSAVNAVNIEMLRPLNTGRDLAMEGAQIPKERDFHFGADVANTVVLTDAETAVLQDQFPFIAKCLAVMDNAERANVKAMLAKLMGAPAEAVTADGLSTSEQVAEKPALNTLSYGDMQSLAKKNGMAMTRQTNKQAIISWLRANHLVG